MSVWINSLQDVPDVTPQLIRKEEKRLNTLSDTGLFWLFIILSLVLLAVAVRIFGELSAQTSGPDANGASLTQLADTRQPRLYTVSYKSGVFSPTNLRIHAGDTVRFRNDGLLPIRVVTDPHPEHNNIAGFDSVGDIPQGSYFAFTFAAKGVFGYHNERNINETGTIIVR